MNTFSKHLFAALIGTALVSSCSRPVAYFQPSAREHFATTTVKEQPVSAAETAASVVAESSTPAEAIPVAATPAQQIAQAQTAMDQVDAMVRNDSKLAANKTLQKRLNRIRTLMTVTSAKTSLAPSETNSVKKMNLMERMLVKKMNKKISKQLAPANPEKAMAITGVLALGAVLLIAGLLLVLLTTGTGATIGVIAMAAGLVFLLIGLL